jgi:hypothetical protein
MIIHKTLVDGRWYQLSLVEQMANIGCDVDRAIRWKNKGDLETSNKAFERALELLFLTISDKKNRRQLRELCRVKYAVADYFAGENSFGFTDESLHKYFFNFNYMAALRRGL